MAERNFQATQEIVQYWKSLGKELSMAELEAYSDNGPIRGLLLDMLSKGFEFPPEAVEIGALYSPLSTQIDCFSRRLLVDPIYSEKGHPSQKPGVSSTSTPLPDALGEIASWSNGNTVLVLENVINYLDVNTIDRLFSLGFSHLIIGNNSGASFGEKHPNRLSSPKEIMKKLMQWRYIPVTDQFVTKDALVGIYKK